MSLKSVAEKFRQEVIQRITNFEKSTYSSSSIKDKDETSTIESIFSKILESKNPSSTKENKLKRALKKQTSLSEEEIAAELRDFQNILDKVEKQEQSNGDDTINNSGDKNPQDAIAEVLNLFFENDEMMQELDSDHNLELSDEEKLNFMTTISAADGNTDSLSIDDILLGVEGIKKGISVEDIALAGQNGLTLDEMQQANAASTTSSPLANQNTHASNYTPPSGELVSYQNDKNISDINQKISDASAKIVELNNKKVEAYNNNNEYKTLIDALNTTTTSLVSANTNLSDFQAQLHQVQFDYIAAETELANSFAPKVLGSTDVDQNGQTMQQEYETRIQKLEQLKLDLKQQEEELKGKITQEETNIKTLTGQKETQEAQVKTYEQQNPNEEVERINKLIQDQEDNIKILEAQKQQLEATQQTQRESELEDAKVYGEAAAYRQSEFAKYMLDYATDESTKAYYDKWYFEHFNGKAYCAIFTSNTAEELYRMAAEAMGLSKNEISSMMNDGLDSNMKTQGVAGTQFSMEAASWGRKAQAAFDNIGLEGKATIDITNMSAEQRANLVRQGLVRPGQVFEYHTANRYHTGIIESINADLSWNTIEGNTTVTYADGTSEKHTVGAHKRDGSYADLTSVADPLMKTYYWLIKSGKMSADEVNRMYNFF